MGSGKPVRTPSGTMVLVIGIILGAFVAMLLIVIIVLKYRTGVDRSAMIKCEDSVGNAPHSHGPPNQGPGNSNAPRYKLPMSVNFLVFFELFFQPFKRTIHALVLSHWTCGRVLICHRHYEQQHVLPPQDYCSYCWRTRCPKDLLDQDLEDHLLPSKL